MTDLEQEHLQVEICAPEKASVTLEANEVIVPGLEGIFAVRPDHTPLLSTLTTGQLVVYPVEGGERYYAVNGGFAEVNENHVLILSQSFESEDEIDLERARAARQRAEERLHKRSEEAIDEARAEAALARAMTRLGAKGREGYG